MGVRQKRYRRVFYNRDVFVVTVMSGCVVHAFCRQNGHRKIAVDNGRRLLLVVANI